jgi:hypothetical protein
MRRVIFIVFSYALVSNIFAQTALNNFLDDTDKFLNNYVKNGLVEYKLIYENRSKINQLINNIEIFDLSAISKPNDIKAFWINTYNLLVILSVIERYPIQSVKEVSGFFDLTKHKVAGELLTLNEIEHNKLLKEFGDARFHFVLVCAAIGCPKIINTTYRPDRLDEQLDHRTKIVLNDDFHVSVDDPVKEVLISELFKWYKKDFVTEGTNVIQFINQYRTQKIPENYSISFITYDWSLNDFTFTDDQTKPSDGENLQAYTPSKLLSKDQFEIKIFNNLYTQTEFFNEEREKIEQGSRSTFFTGIVNFLYGINSSINVGFDLYFKSVRNDEESSSPFTLFEFSSNENARTAIAQIGPKIKISPFSSFSNFSFQTTLLFPLESDLDGSESNESPYLDVDGMQWWNHFFYDYSFDENFLLYLETGPIFRFSSEFEDFFVPLKAIVNYYPSQNWTIYVPSEFTSFWKEFSMDAYYAQLGLGLKYQLTPNVELEGLFTKFLLGKSQGAGQTFNLGIRIIQ